MKLQTKFFLILIPLIVVPMLFVGWIAYERLQSISQTGLKHQMTSAMQSTGDHLKKEIQVTNANITLYAQAEQLINFVLTHDEDQRYSIMLPPLLRLFSSYQHAFEKYIEIRILTPDGYEDARSATFKTKNISEYEDKSDFFKEISKSTESTHTTFFKNPDNGKFNMLVSHKIMLVDYALNPVTKDPPLRGYLVLTLCLDCLQDQVDKNKFGKNGIIFYTDNNGEILFHPDQKRIGTKLGKEDFLHLTNIAARNQEIGTILLENSLFYAKGEKIHPDLYLFAALPGIEYTQAGRTQWALSVLGTIAFTLILIFGAVFAIINIQILIPLKKLNQAVETIGRGELDSKLIIDRKDEIGKLSFEFNSMVEKLREITVSHNYVDEILESMNDSVFVISTQGRIKQANIAACKFTGYENYQLPGKSILDLFPSSNHDIIERISMGVQAVNLEKTMKSRDGSTCPVLFSTSPMLYSKDFDDIICVIHDISDRIKIEQEKIQAQETAAEKTKHALIGQVAGKIAHDFNNILGIIMGHAELALMNPQDAETKNTLELIFGQTIRGKNLTKNLVVFAKSQEPKQEFFRIYEKIDFVVNLLKKDLAEVEVITEDKTNAIEILADPGMIEHALVNLVQNSIHATSRVAHPKINIKSHSSENHIYIEIQDNGCGIPKEYLEEIYSPSFSLKGSKDATDSYNRDIKGTGYGLANVKRYIEQHKGQISVTSQIGSGTKFTLGLPIIKKELAPEEIEEVLTSTTQFNKRILLVEDEQSISEVQYHILASEPFNHRVDIAASGSAAMELLNKNTYDLISLDYVLPGKINGVNVYDYIRKTDKTVKILFVSGNIEFLESINELRRKDAHMDHLSKPCQNKEYIHSINRLLETPLVIN